MLYRIKEYNESKRNRIPTQRQLAAYRALGEGWTYTMTQFGSLHAYKSGKNVQILRDGSIGLKWGK